MDGEVPDAEGAEHVAHRVVGLDDAPGVVGPLVEEEPVAEAEDLAVAGGRDLDVVELLARVGGALEVLAPGLDPLEGAAEPLGDEGDEEVLRVDRALGAEAAADVGRRHPDPVGRFAQRLGEDALEPVRDLRRAPDGEAAARVGNGEHAPRLERHPRAALDADPPAHDHGRGGEGALDVADRDPELDRHVVAEIGVDHGRRSREAALDVGDGGERLPVDLDKVARVLGEVAVRGHDDRDGLADVPDGPGGERVLRRRLDREAHP